MSLTRRRFLHGSVLLAGGTVLAACADDPLQTGGASGGETPGGTKITLQHWYHEYGEEGTHQAALQYAADYTKANPDVAVEVNWVPGDYETAWRSGILGGEGPDVYEWHTIGPEMVASEQVVPLTDVIGGTRSDFDERVLTAVTHGGEIYAIPMIIDLMMLFYRPSLLKAAGVSAPTTFDELVEAAKKLTSGKRKGLFLSNDGIGHMPYVLPWSNGAQRADDRTVTVADAKYIEAIKSLKRLHDEKVLLRDYPTDWWDPGAIISGATAMAWGGMWAVPQMTKELDGDIAAMPWPSFGSGGTPVVNLGGWSQVVNGRGKNIEAAKKYAAHLWIENAQVQQDWALSYGLHLPPRKSAAAAAGPLKSGLAKQCVDFAAAHGNKTNPIMSGEVENIVKDAVTEIATKGADPAKTLGAAQKRAQAAVDKLPKL